MSTASVPNLETFANVRGQMVAGPVFRADQAIGGETFTAVPVPVAELFL